MSQKNRSGKATIGKGTLLLILLAAGALAACQGESVTGPLGLGLREQPGAGPAAQAIRQEALKRSDCPSVPNFNSEWPARTLTKPAGRVFLPSQLRAAPSASSEGSFLSPDMSAGAFVLEAPSLASLEIPRGSPLARSAMTICRLQVGAVESVAYFISQPHPARSGDSVHLAFLQVVVAGEQAVRAGALATTRALRDSLVSALLAFEPASR